MKNYSIFAMALIACGGSPVVGTWKATGATITTSPVTVKANITVVFAAGGSYTSTTETTEPIKTTTAQTGTYTDDGSAFTAKITSLTYTPDGGMASVGKDGTGADADKLCFEVAPGSSTCVAKEQKQSYTISGKEMTWAGVDYKLTKQ